MKKLQNGFSAAETILGIAVLSILGLAGWYVYHTKQNSTSDSATTKDSSSNTNPSGKGTNSCSKNGIIIVMFNDNASKERESEIIATEKVSIQREYTSFKGYSLTVTKGKEQAAVDAFSKYPEVKSANLNSCNYTQSVNHT